MHISEYGTALCKFKSKTEICINYMLLAHPVKQELLLPIQKYPAGLS